MHSINKLYGNLGNNIFRHIGAECFIPSERKKHFEFVFSGLFSLIYAYSELFNTSSNC